MRIRGTGVRKLNFKDFVTEAVGSSTYGSLWEGPSSIPWSIGLGNGVLPSTWKGWGYRFLCVPAGSPAYMYAKTTPPWGTLDQSISGRRVMLQFDFMFRFNTAIAGSGIAFEFMLQHSGSPSWTESKGYRVRFDGTNLYIEKLNTGGGIPSWSLFNDSGSNPSLKACPLSAGVDYYVRVSYVPQDFDKYNEYSLDVNGSFVIQVTDDVDKIGQYDVAYFAFRDDNPMVGSSSDTIGFMVDNGNDAEIDGIVYSDGFLDPPQLTHYFASMHELSQTLTLKFVSAGGELYDFLELGDRVEWWVRERRTIISTPEYSITDDYINVRKMDGRVKFIKDRDEERMTTVVVKDEFLASVLAQKDEESPAISDSDYWGFINRAILSEFPGQSGKPDRVCILPGVSSVAWSRVVSADWTFKGSYHQLFEVLGRIVNVWMFWLPIGILLSQLAAVDTGKKFDLSSLTSEMQWISAIEYSDDRFGGYRNKVTQFHDNGAGAVTSTTTSNSTDIDNYGESSEDRIDVSMPPSEGASASQNRFNQMNDKNPVIDVLCPFYGMDFHIGCKVGIDDPTKGIDEDEYVIIEEEILHSTLGNEDDVRGYHRFKLAYQDNSESATRLPRAEIRQKGRVSEWRNEQAYHDRFWT